MHAKGYVLAFLTFCKYLNVEFYSRLRTPWRILLEMCFPINPVQVCFVFAKKTRKPEENLKSELTAQQKCTQSKESERKENK